MRRAFAPMLLILFVAIFFATPLVWSQDGNCTPGAVCQTDVYQLVFYDNAFNRFHADQAVRIVNPGLQGSPISTNEGNVCADIYVFDDKQNMQECCACPLSANDILQLSLTRNLLQHPVDGKPIRGVIKIVADSYENCNPTAMHPTPNLRSSMEHLEVIPPPKGSPVGSIGTPSLTDTPFEDSELSVFEIRILDSRCEKIIATNACTCL